MRLHPFAGKTMHRPMDVIQILTNSAGYADSYSAALLLSLQSLNLYYSH